VSEFTETTLCVREMENATNRGSCVGSSGDGRPVPPQRRSPTARRTWADLQRRGADQEGVDLRPTDAAPMKESLQ
jgi:hypothetical protein